MGCLFKYQHMGIHTQMCRYADAYAKQNVFFKLIPEFLQVCALRDETNFSLDSLAQTQHIGLIKSPV